MTEAPNTQPIAMFQFESLADDAEAKRVIETAMRLGKALGRAEAAEEIAEELETINPKASTLYCAMVARSHALPPKSERPLHVMSCDDCRADLDVRDHYPDCSRDIGKGDPNG